MSVPHSACLMLFKSLTSFFSVEQNSTLSIPQHKTESVSRYADKAMSYRDEIQNEPFVSAFVTWPLFWRPLVAGVCFVVALFGMDTV